MRVHEDSFPGRGGKRIFRRQWLPGREPRANVLLVHGLAEHCGRYGPLVDHLVAQGYAVHGFDHQGHGRSEGPTCHADSLGDFTDNLHHMVRWAKAQWPDRPLFLFGHSMGGLISAHYLVDHQDQVEGAVLSAPAVMSADQPSFLQKLRAGLLYKLKPTAPFRQLNPDGISRNTDVVRAYLDDPLVHGKPMSIGLAVIVGSAMARLRQRAAEVMLPLLVVQGGRDTLVNPAGAKALFDWVGSEDKHLEVYPEAYHEVLNEPEAPEFLELVGAWLAKRMDRLAA